MTTASKLTNASTDCPTPPKRKQPANSHKLEGLLQLEPYAQGELDSLCGLYSIINAIRLVRYPVAPVSAAKSRSLFEAGIDFLRQNGSLEPAIVNGINIRRWKLLAALLAEQAGSPNWSVAVETTKHRMPARAIMRYIDDSVAKGSPVLLHLGRRHQHYTAIGGVTPHSILLFDSWRLSRANRDGFVRRYDIAANSMMRLIVQLRIYPIKIRTKVVAEHRFPAPNYAIPPFVVRFGECDI